MITVSSAGAVAEESYFLAESSMPAMTESDLEATRHALDQASSRLRNGGVGVRHIGSAYIRSRGRWICLFSARSCADVRRVSEVAQIMFSSIEEVIAVSALTVGVDSADKSYDVDY